MHRKRPSPRRFLSHAAPARAAPGRPEDDPWAGEDVDWQVEADREHEAPGAFVGFFAAVAVAAVVGGVFWTAVVLVMIWLL